jgi:tetratricopeptide (TPR) repeat protein
VIELNVRFTGCDRFVIKFDDRETEAIAFVSPVNDDDRGEIRWYLESYAAHYMMDVDDRRAERIEAKLPEWGKALFEAIFGDRVAARIFNDFQDADEKGKVLTIGASHPAILALPWELLRDPSGTYLLHENPRIAIRRKFAGVTGGRSAARVKPKEQLRVLMVVSRPSDAGFLDPRAEGLAMLAAMQETGDRVAVEFLRPATLDKLVERLEDDRLPAVDIVHFDGHGAFDPDGRLHERAKQSDRGAAMKADANEAANTGYLLFEDVDGKSALITAETLGDMLNRQRVSAIVLSACQSAAVGGEDALGSVAARLTHAGMPTVLAMQYSVLAVTARQLFGKFYGFLLRGQGVGEALENARRDLYLNKERGERPRGQERVILKVQDWFLPALYQVGQDVALFKPEVSPHPQPLSQGARGAEASPEILSSSSRVGDEENLAEILSSSPSGRGARGEGSNLRESQEAGFWGRSAELWAIERAFVRGTRRLTISGFGGMGKTYLAEEAGRWLLRTGMFARVCFVSFADYQGIDPVGYALSVLATVLDTNLIDATAATRALAQQPVLVILDNLETVRSPLAPLAKGGKEEEEVQVPLIKGDLGGSPSGDNGDSLLTAAKAWSEAGASRVLLTTRADDLRHPDYANVGTTRHILLPLRGLSPNDALDYFQSLMKLPPLPSFGLPTREGLLELFEMLDYHPLSLGLLANQLKQRRAMEVQQELAQLVAATPNNPLLASLNLSVSRLDPEVKKWLPRLGVFQGGVFEFRLLAIVDIEEKDWDKIRSQLRVCGLIEVQCLTHDGDGISFIKFHPTLAPTMWSRLNDDEQKKLLIRYKKYYYQLSHYLYVEDRKSNPFAVRVIARLELPNLMFAVRDAIKSKDNFAVDFFENINCFLNNFWSQAREDLNRQVQSMVGDIGSQPWYLIQSSLGEQLHSEGRYAETETIFQKILLGLGTFDSYERCITLSRLGSCYKASGKLQKALEQYGLALSLAKQLEQTDDIRRQIGVLQSDLGEVWRASGKYENARESYRFALEIMNEVGDTRSKAVIKCQLGILALTQNNFLEAVQILQESLIVFRELQEPATEAIVLHELGIAFYELGRWKEAEQAYRLSAQIKDVYGLVGGMNGLAITWHGLAIVSVRGGQFNEAEEWYCKAIKGFKDIEDKLSASKALSNLANLLQQDPNRLNEAKQLAEESLAIKQTLDPAAARIWTTYELLAQISEKQGDLASAKDYRCLSRESKANFAGTQYELRQHAQLIVRTVRAVDDPEVRQQLEPILENMISRGWQNLIAAIQQILNGQRDEDILCEGLDMGDSQIVIAILRGINDPETLKAFIPDDAGA